MADVEWYMTVDITLEPNWAKVEAAYRDALSEAFSQAKQILDEEYKQVVESFYGSYSPIYYGRNESLRNLFRLEINGDVITGGFDDGAITPFERGGSSYEAVFHEGRHGGAASGPEHPSPGVPYYRAPPYKWTHWSSPAAISTPPYDQFMQRLESHKKEFSLLVMNLFFSKLASLGIMAKR